VRVFTSSLEAIPGAYVKVYSKESSGAEKFYKDGYTDPIGQFDYVSLNSDSLRTVEKFSILVKHDQYGEIITEAAKPN